MDVWVCKEGINEDWSGDEEYWCVFVDRSVADPKKVKKLIRWSLLRGMGTGLEQKDMAPFIQPYLQQVKGEAVDKLTSLSATTSEQSKPCFELSVELPPAYEALEGLLKGSK